MTQDKRYEKRTKEPDKTSNRTDTRTSTSSTLASTTSKEKTAVDLPPTKVVIRRLPPSLTSETLLELISPIPDHDYFNFVKADLTLGQHAFSRAYINFCDHKDVWIFQDKFDGYIFIDAKGSEYPAVVEFAPFLKVPKKKGKKPDPRKGTIETDPDYVRFLEQLKNAELEPVQLPETFLEEIEAREKELKANHGCLKVTTPLIDYIVKKRDEKRTAILQQREDKRKKDAERRRQQEEELRRRQERIRERQRERERQRLKEKDERERRRKEEAQHAQDAAVPPIKLLRNPDREREDEKQKSANVQEPLVKSSNKDMSDVRPKSTRDYDKPVRERDRDRAPTGPPSVRDKDRETDRKKDAPVKTDVKDDANRPEKDVSEKAPGAEGPSDQRVYTGRGSNRNRQDQYSDRHRDSYHDQYKDGDRPSKEHVKDVDKATSERGQGRNRDGDRYGDRDKYRDSDRERYSGGRYRDSDRYRDSGNQRYNDRDRADRNVDKTKEPAQSRAVNKDKERQDEPVEEAKKKDDRPMERVESGPDDKKISDYRGSGRDTRYQDQRGGGGGQRDRRYKDQRPHQQDSYRGGGYRNRADSGYTQDDDRPRGGTKPTSERSRQSSEGEYHHGGTQKKFSDDAGGQQHRSSNTARRNSTDKLTSHDDDHRSSRVVKSEEKESIDGGGSRSSDFKEKASSERLERSDSGRHQRMRYKDRPEREIYNPARRAAERMKDGKTPSSDAGSHGNEQYRDEQ